MMFGMGDACDDGELNYNCSCMVVVCVREEVMILGKSERIEDCYGQVLLWCT
jgi:hypothetical protein